MVIMNVNYYKSLTQKELYLASSLYDSVEDNDLKAVKSLLERSANPNILLPDKGISSFHLVIGIDSAKFAKQCTELFLQYRGDPNVRSEDDLTPVHIAAAWGRPEILDLLLKCGGDPTIQDQDNMNALDYAISENDLKSAALITKFIATVRGNADIVDITPYELSLEKVLIDNGALQAEYEVSKNRTTDALSHIPFDLSHNEDYIRKWCQNAGLANSQGDFSMLMQSNDQISPKFNKISTNLHEEKSPQVDSDYSTSAKTSVPSSLSPVPRNSFFVPKNLTLNSSSAVSATTSLKNSKSPCKVIHLNTENEFVVNRRKLGEKSVGVATGNGRDMTAKSTPSSSNFTLDASSLSSFRNPTRRTSRESGINTLPLTSADNYDLSETVTGLDGTNSVSIIRNKNNSSEETFLSCLDNTAVSWEPPSQLERNVFDDSVLTSDLSDPGANVVNNNNSNNSLNDNNVSRKISVISVSSTNSSLVSDPIDKDAPPSVNGSDPLRKFGSVPVSIITIPSSDESSGNVFNVAEEYRYSDKDNGIELIEKRLIVDKNSDTESLKSIHSSKLSSLPSNFDYDSDILRQELIKSGCEPGPINNFTKRVYLRKLRNILKNGPPKMIENRKDISVFSFELEKTFKDPSWTENLTTFKKLDVSVSEQFSIADPTRRWREGCSKSSFTYLLLDPRITNNLPCRAENLTFAETWKIFLSSVFYVGKGKRSRPYAHLYEAIGLWNRGKTKSSNEKLQKILDIWSEKCGVICLHVFQNVIPVEAYTREAAMISALDVTNLKNMKSGDFYGVAATWTQSQKKSLGVYLLYRALLIFLNEGERQLRPADIE